MIRAKMPTPPLSAVRRASLLAALFFSAASMAQERIDFASIGVDGWFYRGDIYATPEHVPPFIWEINGSRGQEERVEALFDFARAANPNVVIARYTSATTTLIGDDGYALSAFVPARGADLLPVSYDTAGRRPYMDIRREPLRRRIAMWASQMAIEARHDAIALDNLSFGMGVPPTRVMPRAEWEAAEIALLERVHDVAGRNGLKLIVNVACSPAAHWRLFSQHVDGVLCELPLHTAHVIPNPARVEAELAAYAAMLRAGKYVGLVPYEQTTQEYRVPHAELCAAALMLVREPGQACGVYEPSFRPLLRTWRNWPTVLGAPSGAYRRDGGDFVREFERGALRVDFAARRVVVTINRRRRRSARTRASAAASGSRARSTGCSRPSPRSVSRSCQSAADRPRPARISCAARAA